METLALIIHNVSGFLFEKLFRAHSLYDGLIDSDITMFQQIRHIAIGFSRVAAFIRLQISQIICQFNSSEEWNGKSIVIIPEGRYIPEH